MERRLCMMARSSGFGNEVNIAMDEKEFHCKGEFKGIHKGRPNVRDTSLRDALKSKLFTKIIEADMLVDDHKGGCVLFEKRKEVEAQLEALEG